MQTNDLRELMSKALPGYRVERSATPTQSLLVMGEPFVGGRSFQMNSTDAELIVAMWGSMSAMLDIIDAATEMDQLPSAHANSVRPRLHACLRMFSDLPIPNPVPEIPWQIKKPN